MVLGDLPSLPGSNVQKGDLPEGPQPFTDKYSSGGSSGNKVYMLNTHKCCVAFGTRPSCLSRLAVAYLNKLGIEYLCCVVDQKLSLLPTNLLVVDTHSVLCYAWCACFALP